MDNHRNTITPGDSLADWEINLANEQRIRQEQEKSSPSLEKDEKVKIIGESNEQCIQYFKRISGIQRTLGYAGSIRIQGTEPRIGAGALWKNYGHIGYVVAIKGNIIVVDDTNWIRGKITEHRLTMSDLRGFIYN